MTVSIDDPEDQKWIKMELIKAADMEKGTVSESGFTAYTGAGNGDHLATGTPWTAGNGKRAFFTTSLFKDGTPLKDEVEVTTTRDRVYFYIDENLSDSEDRTATVTLTYYEGDSDIPVETRELDITQVHLLKVQVYLPKNVYVHKHTGEEISEVEYNDLPWWSGERDNYTKVSVIDESNPYNGDGGVIYMEQFEEYLDHYDPLDDYTGEALLYDGLTWIGESNSNYYVNHEIPGLCEINPTILGNAGDWIIEDPSTVYYDGLICTGFLIYLANQGNTNLNGRPKSAVEYCFNKNKRNEDGEVEMDYHKESYLGREYECVAYNRSKWFLPGIRQMESSLYTYYNMFPEFQGNFYWSCAAGKAGSGNNQSPTTARATMINARGHYTESVDGSPGSKLRTDVIRIRAFRIDLDSYEY